MDTLADSNPYTHRYRDEHADTYSHSDGNVDTYSDGNPYGYQYAVTNRD